MTTRMWIAAAIAAGGAAAACGPVLEFYRGKKPAPDLMRRLDASEAKFAARADVFRGDQQDIRNVVARYECERTTFGVLWRGGAPGSSACAGPCKTSG